MADDKKSGLKLLDNKQPKDTMKLGEDAPAEAPKPRVLSEVESLKLELVSLQQQKIELEKKLLTAQEAMIGLKKENLDLRSKMETQDHERLFDALGLKGKTVNLTKNAEGRYEVVEKTGG